MKKGLIILLLLSSVIATQAQVQVALGLKAGVNLSKLDGGDADASSITGFNGGAFALFKLAKIGIQPEFLFSQQGSTIDDVSLGKQDLKMSYITIPVMVKLYLVAGLNIQAGPQFGFLNSAELEGDDYKDYIKGSDVSANVGLGWDAPFGLMFDARYNIGLSDINDGFPNTSDAIKSQVIQISVGYKLFKFGK